jgi:acyl-CoA dehydrogenase
VNELRELMVDSATKIMKDICSKEMVNEVEKGAWAQELWETLAESGMITVAVPEELGGSGGEYGDALSILRVSGKYSAPIPLADTFIVNWLFSKKGLAPTNQPLTMVPVNQKDQITFTEDASGFYVSGEAKNVPWDRFAEAVLVIGGSEKGYQMALVDTNRCKIESGQNLAGEPRGQIRFDQVHVQSDECFTIDQNMIQNVYYWGALTRAVLMGGALERILELTLNYSRERHQFGRPISRFQAVQQQIAVMAGEVTAAQVAVDHAIEAFTGEISDETAFAKIRVSEAAAITAPIAHQIHGAIGFTDEHVLHQSTRRLWTWRDEFGTETEWEERIGNKVIDGGSKSLWSFITS